MNAYSFEFWNTIPKPYNRIKDNLSESSGFYQLVFNQNSQVSKTRISIVTYDQILAFLGGYFGLVYAFFAVFSGKYSEYALDMTLIKSIYQQDGRGESVSEGETHFDTDIDEVNHRFKSKVPPPTLGYCQ